MKRYICKLFSYLSVLLLLVSFAPAKDRFTVLEQQQVSVPTPGIFARSNAFNVDFSILNDKEYSFPLPVGKAEISSNAQDLNIYTSAGDAVKAMFAGYVRMSKSTPSSGNVIVVRHDNGLETVYSFNSQNLVKVGQRVNAGQTIAIVGNKNGKGYCQFSIMINGFKINPETILGYKSHKLRKNSLLCENKGNHVKVTLLAKDKDEEPMDEADLLAGKRVVGKLNLANISNEKWAYPLPGARVISPYGGRRRHAGVDVKTCPNDKILAAFGGVVTRSCPYYGYGNCIVIRHNNGLETLYSHQSKNLVKVGERVKAGDVIGLTGRTGRATTEHLHFEVRFNGVRINPALVFDHLNHSLQQSTLTYNGGRVRCQKNSYAQN